MPCILFLCTYNSVRSQTAEGVCRMLHPGWEVFSAGIAPGTISSRVIRILEETGCDCSGMYANISPTLPTGSMTQSSSSVKTSGDQKTTSRKQHT